MNGAQIHLLVNHLPSIGQIIGILVFTAGLAGASLPIRKTGVWIIFISALMVLPASWSGESAEEQIEHMAGISEAQMEAHEDAAGRAWVMSLINGAAALGWLISAWRLPQAIKPLSAVLLITSAISIVLIVVASHEGGLIRHPELNSGATVQPVGGHEDDD